MSSIYLMTKLEILKIPPISIHNTFPITIITCVEPNCHIIQFHYPHFPCLFALFLLPPPLLVSWAGPATMMVGVHFIMQTNIEEFFHVYHFLICLTRAWLTIVWTIQHTRVDGLNGINNFWDVVVFGFVVPHCELQLKEGSRGQVHLCPILMVHVHDFIIDSSCILSPHLLRVR